MRKGVITALAAAGATAIGGAIIYYLQEKATSGPDYRVLLSDGDMEIRDYPAMVVAQTVTQGPRKRPLARASAGSPITSLPSLAAARSCR